MMKQKKIMVIGAGMAGLSAGYYLQASGYHTEIFESHCVPGGLFTSWKRKNYLIEGCIHGLLGSSPDHPLYKLWNEIIDMNKIKFINPDIKSIIYFEDGRQFHYYANIDRLREYLLDISPEDKEIINKFIRAVKRIKKLEMNVDKPRELYSFKDYIKMLKFIPAIPFIRKWNNISSRDFSKKLKSPFLQRVFSLMISPILFEMFVLSEMDQKRSGYPTCGSLKFVEMIINRYISIGGKLNYNSKVSKINVKNNKATGVELATGEICNGDIVISAADARTTIYDMLEGKFTSKKIDNMFKLGDVNTSRIQISIGVDRTFKDMPLSIVLPLDTSYTICDGSRYESLDVLVFSDLPDQIPKGKTLLSIQLETENSEYWTRLRKENKKGYLKEKNKIADEIIDMLESRLGNIKDNIDLIDVTTPSTYIRYTNNWKGSAQGWSNEKLFAGNILKNTLPGLENFYMVGQWVKPGAGIPNVFMSGRNIAQIICNKDKINFCSTYVKYR